LGISLRNQQGSLETVDLKGLPTALLTTTRFGTTIDPLREYVIKHHAPVHEQVLFTEESWKRSALYIHGCGLQYNHEHAMTGPIVGHGQLIGMVHFARTVAILLLMPKILQISVPCVLTIGAKSCYVFAQSDLHQNGQLD